ncbi:MAG: hypothetical protein HYY16_08875 [Planctomycetes bacterium]|nr:hypothetical protein [Planctomycetota bacterium]
MGFVLGDDADVKIAFFMLFTAGHASEDHPCVGVVLESIGKRAHHPLAKFSLAGEERENGRLDEDMLAVELKEVGRPGGTPSDDPAAFQTRERAVSRLMVHSGQPRDLASGGSVSRTFQGAQHSDVAGKLENAIERTTDISTPSGSHQSTHTEKDSMHVDE